MRELDKRFTLSELQQYVQEVRMPAATGSRCLPYPRWCCTWWKR